MYIPTKASELDLNPELIVEVFNETPEDVNRTAIGLVDEWIVTFDNARLRISLQERTQKGIVQPDVSTGRSHIRLKPPRVTQMQVPQSRGQHDKIPGGLAIPKD